MGDRTSVYPQASQEDNSGIATTGSFDANRTKADRAQRQSNEVSRAFDVNANIDSNPTFGMQSLTNNGLKIAAFEAGAAAAWEKFAGNGLPGPAALPKIPAMPKTPKASVKVPAKVQPLDARTNVPAGSNLQQGTASLAAGADTGNSLTAFSRRLQGSPV